MDSKNKRKTPVGVEQLVERVASHLPGYECACSAYGESECGCPDTDWRSCREVAAVTALKYCLATLKAYHTTKPGITETIRQTEMIRDAGERRRLADNTPTL